VILKLMPGNNNGKKGDPDNPAETDEQLNAGAISLQPAYWSVTVSGVPIELTYIEHLLLLALVTAKGKVLGRDTLLEQVWKYGNVNLLETRTVDVHIGRLRKKLGEAGDQIITVRNVGYRMAFVPEWINH